MKKLICTLIILAHSIFSFSQISPESANVFEDGFTPAELEYVLLNAPYKDHAKWMKKAGYTYDKAQSTDEYYFYEKNGVVRFALYYRNNAFHQVLAVSSPQKFYQALSKIKENGNYRLVEENVGDIGNGKFMKSAKWVKNGYVYKADSDNAYLTVYRDFEGLSSKPTIRSFDHVEPKTGGGASADVYISNLQYFLKTVGSVYPKAGESYDGKQRVINMIENIDKMGKVRIEKIRYPNDCESVNSFNVREQVNFHLRDVTDVIIHTYTSENGADKLYAVCIIVKDWDKSGDRRYEILSRKSSKPCKPTDDWKTGRKSAYVRPYPNTAIAIEMTSERWARDTKSYLDGARAALQ